MNKINIGATVLVLVGAGLYVVVSWYWQSVCVSAGCTSYLKAAYLAPLREAGLVLAVISLPFIFLPYHYFKSWLGCVLLPATLVTLYSMYSIDPNSSHILRTTREEAMSNFMYWWLPITLLFIAYHWYRSRKI